MSEDSKGPLFVAPQMLRTPMRDLFPEQTHLAEHFEDAVDRIRLGARKRQIWSIVINLIFYSIILTVGGWVIAQATDRDIPIRSEITITTPAVPAGKDLEMLVKPYRYKLCETRVTFVIYDGQDRMTTIEMDWQQPKGKIGPDKPFIRPLTLPYDAKPGNARLRILRAFRCPFNVFQQRWPITDVSSDMPFKILPESR